ncbi:MAG: acyl-CoA thioesterase [Bacteroidia bacterium]|nr:acyl-CoA thioesterase [Bacteroidia bacterium]
MNDFRPVHESRIEISELMIPSYANFGGKVHGGYILSLMDKIAYACATRHARNYCVTASVDTVDFRHPIEVGSLVRMYASVNYVGNTSMEVGIRTESHNIRTGEFTHTNTSYFTMVAIGENGKKTLVPGLILEEKNDVRRFLEGRERKRLKREYGRARANLKSDFQIELAIKELQNERCEVAWNHNA